AILRGKTVAKATIHQFLLRQMVKCGGCGRRTLTGERQKGHLYYRCHDRTCRGVSWRADALESIALDRIVRVRMDDRDIRDLRDLVEKEYRTRDDDIEQLKASLTLRLQHLDNRLA